jgi:hypothetical protein
VTIKRTWKQALQNGRLQPREQSIPFSNIAQVRHHGIGQKSSFLQITSKPGTPGLTPFNKNAKMHFSIAQEHTFRQAQRLIEERLQQLNGQSPDNSGHLSLENRQ